MPTSFDKGYYQCFQVQMTDSDADSLDLELRKRNVPDPVDENLKNDDNTDDEKSIIDEKEKESEKEMTKDSDTEADFEAEAENEAENIAETEALMEIQDNDEPKVTVCRGIRNLQPMERPCFIVRQFRAVKNIFIEFIDFILLFLTTLFNPMADVNVQVQEHNQRRVAREGRYFSSNNKPRNAPFPGCGPSS